MYITQEIVRRIRGLAKSRNVKTGVMLSECGLGINALSEFDKGKHISCISLATISDYLDCSVDYLLGRTDNPQSHKYSLHIGNVSSNSGAIGVGNTVTNNAEPKNVGQGLLLEIFSKIPQEEQAQLLGDHLAKNYIKNNFEQPKTDKKAKYRIGISKSTDEEREKIIKYLEFYECELVKDYKSYMVFSVDYDFNIEEMLAARGFEVSVKKLPS